VQYRDGEEVSVMTTAIIGTGGLGSVIARQLASGGETLRLSSANQSARTLAAEIGRAAVVGVDNRDALRGADAVVLALRFPALTEETNDVALCVRGERVARNDYELVDQRVGDLVDDAVIGSPLRPENL
jgi:predicted dinucleotide-binding enzyme